MAARIASRGISEEERFHLFRLAWFYRRKLPAHLAPRMNPEDPIVMSMEAAGGFNG